MFELVGAAGIGVTEKRPRRPTEEDYQRALALYRANATPEAIAERVGLTPEQVDRAMFEGWPPTRGKVHRPALRAWEHEIDDRVHRARLAALDWAQSVAEGAAVHAKDWGQTLRTVSPIKQSLLRAWGAQVKVELDRARLAREAPKVSAMTIGIDATRNLKILHTLMDPAHQAKLADVYRFLSGDEGDADAGQDGQLQALLAELTDEQIEHWEETGDRPDPEQKVIEFPTSETG